MIFCLMGIDMPRVKGGRRVSTPALRVYRRKVGKSWKVLPLKPVSSEGQDLISPTPSPPVPGVVHLGLDTTRALGDGLGLLQGGLGERV